MLDIYSHVLPSMYEVAGNKFDVFICYVIGGTNLAPTMFPLDFNWIDTQIYKKSSNPLSAKGLELLKLYEV